MNRPRSYTIATVIIVLFNLVSIFLIVPALARGPNASDLNNGEPFFVTVINFVLLVLGFVSAYGVWQVQKWGVILAIVVAALSMLTPIPVLIATTSLTIRLVGVLGILFSAVIIVLLLRPRLEPTRT